MKIEILEKKKISQNDKFPKYLKYLQILIRSTRYKVEQIHVTEECDITDQFKSSYWWIIC